jgi:GTP-binding protein
MTDTKGNGIINQSFDGYGPYKGDISYRAKGSLIAFETGEALTYGLFNAQERGMLFITPGDAGYAGQVIGEHVHDIDLVINVCKAKQLTNVRASGTDEKARIIPATIFSLEEALEYIKEDEYVEVTPQSMRMRKVILDHLERKRAGR